MNEALSYFIGEYDFAAFAANRGKEYESTVRIMTQSDMTLEGAFLTFRFRANGFMYKMVRSLVGSLVNIGLGVDKPKAIGELLESGERVPFVLVAPANGLFLEKVFY